MLPHWARKPKHQSTVIATNKGWVVKETGELLKSVKNLELKLSKLKKRQPVGIVAEESETGSTSQSILEKELDMLDDSGDDTQKESTEEPVEDVIEKDIETTADESQEAEKEEQDDTETESTQTNKTKSRRGRPRKK